jgi:hypothetical protein
MEVFFLIIVRKDFVYFFFDPLLTHRKYLLHEDIFYIENTMYQCGAMNASLIHC